MRQSKNSAIYHLTNIHPNPLTVGVQVDEEVQENENPLGSRRMLFSTAARFG